MNQLSLTNNRFKFKTSLKFMIDLEKCVKYASNLIKKNRKITTCNRMNLRALGVQHFNPLCPKLTLYIRSRWGHVTWPTSRKRKGKERKRKVGKWVSGKKSKERKGKGRGERWVSGKKSKERKGKGREGREERWVSGKKSKGENWFGVQFQFSWDSLQYCRQREREAGGKPRISKGLLLNEGRDLRDTLTSSS
jgi:hypothetical protein